VRECFKGDIGKINAFDKIVTEREQRKNVKIKEMFTKISF